LAEEEGGGRHCRRQRLGLNRHQRWVAQKDNPLNFLNYRFFGGSLKTSRQPSPFS
jgi:hypothetical protein